MKLFYDDVPTATCTCHVLVKICQETGKIANEYCELAEGNTVEEAAMLLYNKDWKVEKDKEHVYNPEDEEQVCHVHTKDNTKPTEPTEPTEPIGPSPILPWH